MAANDDTEDNTPLSKLGALKKEDNAHLQLVNQAKGFAAKLDSLRLHDFLDDDASFILELPDDRHGVREELRDLRTLLELNSFDESKALRHIKLLLNYWAVMYEEPQPVALAQLMDHLKSLEEHLKCLDGETPSPIAADSIMGEGHQRLHELDAAYSKTMVDLKHHIEEGDGA